MNEKTRVPATFIIALIILFSVGILLYIQRNNSTNQQDSITEESFPEDKSNEKSQKNIEYIDINAEGANNLIKDLPEIIIIDVSPNYKEGHIPNAVNYYVGDGSLEEAIPTLDIEATYLVYCHVDSASISGAQKLIDAGIDMVYRLEGNYAAWVEAGFPIEI